MTPPEDFRPAPPQPCEIAFSHQTPGAAAEVAVIVPAREAAPFLAECLESVRAQTLDALELVVVDDASPDAGRQVARDWLERNAGRFARAQLACHARQAGPAAARDSGARLSRAPALLLDADNRLFPRCAERCLAGLRASGAAFVYPILARMGLGTGLVGYQPYEPRRFLASNFIDTLALLRRDAWEALGGFPHVGLGMEDYALWLALLERGLTGAQVPEILAAYRVHGRSRTQAMGPAHEAISERLRARHAALLARHGGPLRTP